MPKLLFADERGQVYEHPELLAVARGGLPRDPPVPLPAHATLAALPGRRPVGMDPRTGALEELSGIRVAGRTIRPVAVAAILPPGWTRTELPAYRRLAVAPLLPQWAYTAAAWAELDVIQADGATYQRLGLDKWTKRTGSVPSPSWQGATDPQVAAVESLDGAKAWHIRAQRSGGGYEMWVRQSDGYPLRVITSSAGGAVFTFDFDDYNRGSVVKAPPPFQVKPAPKNLSGRVGDTLALNTARVTLASADLDARSTDFVQPRPGNRFVVVEVAIENTGRDLLSTYVDWRLTDASGYSWPRSVAVRSPSFLGGELPPAAVSHGFLTYEVTRTASSLTLTVRFDDDSAAFALG